MIPSIIVPPVAEPVSLGEAQSWLRATNSDDDADILGLIVAARIYCEKHLSKALLEQTLEITLDYWPGPDGRIELPRARPVRSVAFVKYKDSGGVETTLTENTDFAVDYDELPGCIAPLPTFGVWPVFVPWPLSAIRIRYVAGDPIESPPVPFPENYKLAMRMLICHWYDNRSAVIVGENATIESKVLEMAVDVLLGIDEPPTSF